MAICPRTLLPNVSSGGETLSRRSRPSLSALAVRMRQPIAFRITQANPRRLVEDAGVLASFTAILSAINRQIHGPKGEIIALIDADPMWRVLDRACREIKGVADCTVASLITHLPEIGTLSGKAVAKLTGLAPIDSAVSSSRPDRSVALRAASQGRQAMIQRGRHDPGQPGKSC